LEYISPEVAADVLQEYHRLTMTQQFLSQGGQEYARKLLVKAFGELGAQGLLEQAMQVQEARAHKLDSLQKADPQQLTKFIQGEHPQTIALVLAHLEPKAASTVLALLPEKIRTQAVKRLARMQQFSPEVVQRIAMVLHTKLESLGEQKRRSYGGVEAVAELMNRMNVPMTKSILEVIEQEDTQLATSIRNFMFTFEDLVEVPDASIRELLSHVDKKALAVAMKGASEQLKGHLLKSMSSRGAEIMKEDIEALGPMRSRDVHQAQQEVVNLARQLESQGKLMLKPEAEETYVV
jgi:flagellar motor switch protein FliG